MNFTIIFFNLRGVGHYLLSAVIGNVLILLGMKNFKLAFSIGIVLSAALDAICRARKESPPDWIVNKWFQPIAGGHVFFIPIWCYGLIGFVGMMEALNRR